MMNRIRRHNPLALVVVVSAGVEVAIQPWEVTARNFHTNSVPRLEIVCGGVEVDMHFVHASLVHEHPPVEALAVASPQDSLLHVVRTAVGMHVHYFDRKVRVSRRSRHVQNRL